ncbi:hypothetical protein J4526_00610 [Desulfurococcaceae archaeon MEX13E-LK6-19]|nr:hypothetical protein J4526_00610 [Desulfurococcaceae archaeon MEX13E-LK6-19]
MKYDLVLLRYISFVFMILIILSICNGVLTTVHSLDIKNMSTQTSDGVVKAYSMVLGIDGAYMRVTNIWDILTLQDQVLSVALTWFNTYFRECYNDLYNYIKENNLEKIIVTFNDALNVYDVALSSAPIAVGVKVKIIGETPVISGYHVYIRANNDSSDDELYSLVQKYRDYNISTIAQGYFGTYRLPSFIKINQGVRTTIETNSEGEVITKTISLTYNFSYGNYTLVFIDLDNVGIRIPRLGLSQVYSKTSAFTSVAFSVSGVENLIELYTIVRNTAYEKFMWNISGDEVAYAISSKTKIEKHVIANELEKYIGILVSSNSSNILRPIYYLKHVEHISKGEFNKYGNVTIAIVFADTGEVHLLNMMVPAWGSSVPVYRNVEVFNIFGEQEEQTNIMQTTTTTTTTSTIPEEQQSSTPTSITSTSSTTPKGGNEGETTGIPVSYAIIGLIIFMAIIVVAFKSTRVKS